MVRPGSMLHTYPKSVPPRSPRNCSLSRWPAVSRDVVPPQPESHARSRYTFRRSNCYLGDPINQNQADQERRHDTFVPMLPPLYAFHKPMPQSQEHVALLMAAPSHHRASYKIYAPAANDKCGYLRVKCFPVAEECLPNDVGQ